MPGLPVPLLEQEVEVVEPAPAGGGKIIYHRLSDYEPRKKLRKRTSKTRAFVFVDMSARVVARSSERNPVHVDAFPISVFEKRSVAVRFGAGVSAVVDGIHVHGAVSVAWKPPVSSNKIARHDGDLVALLLLDVM